MKTDSESFNKESSTNVYDSSHAYIFVVSSHWPRVVEAYVYEYGPKPLVKVPGIDLNS